VPEKRIKIPFPNVPGGTVEGVEVSITESVERWSEVRLEDGSVLRVKPNVIGVVRVDGQYDQEGNPLYALKTSQAMAVVSAPEHLRKGGQGKKVQ
jgi:uncharacterized OB-fold protein